MRKLAFFVEGQTETLFISRLVEEIAGKNRVRVERHKASGGQKSVRTLRLVECSKNVGQTYFVLIVDCGGHNSVKSDIRDHYDSLVRNGYQAIVGIRDVYPEFLYGDIPKLRKGLTFKLKTTPIRVLFALAIMEIEAWFITEYTHFVRINTNLTIDHIRAELGFDLITDNVELRAHPAEDLHNIYRLAGFAYNKHKANAKRTVDALDYGRVYFELGQKFADLKAILDCIDGFLSREDYE